MLELLATIVGCPLTVEAASDAARAAQSSDWAAALTHSCRRAGLKGAVFTVNTADELSRLTTLGTPAVTKLGDAWLLVLGTGRLIQATVIDPLGEHRQAMTVLGLREWLERHGSPLPIRWVAVEARSMLAPTEHAPTEYRRLIRTILLERQYISIALVFGCAMAATSLAVPIAAQALVNTVAKSLLLQPLLMLGLLLLVALSAVGILQVVQIVVAEKVHRRIWVRTTTDWFHRLPRTSRANRHRYSNTELANRFFDVCLLQKDVVSLTLDGSSLVLTTGASLLLLAFYHPWLLAFDIVLIVGIALVVASGWGAADGAIHESDCKYDMFAWMDDVSGGRLIFADPRGRAFADKRGEMLLRRWLNGRNTYYRRLLRQISTGVALQVIATVVLLCLGGWLVIQRELTLGQLVAASVLVSTIGAGLSRLGRQLDPIYEGVAAVATFGRTLDSTLEPEGGVLLPALDQPMQVALHDRSNEDALVVALEPGQRLGLRGCTSSHSRVFDLLYGLFGPTEPTSISAHADGFDTRMLDCEGLRAQVGLVRGNEVVWATVRDNLDLGQRGDESELHELLELVGLRKHLLELPAGLDTMLFRDLDGAPLDDSQVRRVVLARVLLAKPRLLLIDRGLDNLGLDAEQREQLYNWIFDRSRPWTLIVATESPDSAELLRRCDHTLEIPNC